MSLALQAQAMGLFAHAMGGFDREKLAAAIHLPEGHTLHCVVAVGEQGPAEALPDDLAAREKPSSRKPVEDISRHGRVCARAWNSPRFTSESTWKAR